MKPTVMITVNVHGIGPELTTMPEESLVARFGYGHYTYNIGLRRLLDSLRSLSIKGTFFWPVFEANKCPRYLEECLADGHEVASHGNCFEDQAKLGTKEKETLESARDALKALTGKAPRGFRSPNWTLSLDTFSHLNSLGYQYDSSSVDDDAPYSLAADGGGNMMELPWCEDLCDATHFRRKQTQSRAFRFFQEEFDALIAVEGYACFTFHPRVDIGIIRDSRLREFARFVDKIRKQYGVEFRTCEEVAALASKGAFKPVRSVVSS